MYPLRPLLTHSSPFTDEYPVPKSDDDDDDFDEKETERNDRLEALQPEEHKLTQLLTIL